MQVLSIPAAQKNLRQGTIVSLIGIKFQEGNGTITFGNMYPYVNLKKVTYGIILSQTCDLVDEGQDAKRKIETPYISIALLEPIERYLEEKLADEIIATIEKNTIDFQLGANESTKFINQDAVLSYLKNSFTRVFQNNDKFFFFITLKHGRYLRLYTVNLAKTFPLRSVHHSALRNKAKYQLKPFFENKLGWKLAEVYGRVGTPDYKAADLTKLSEILMEKVEKVLKTNEGIQIPADKFAVAKNLVHNGTSQKRKDFLTELMSEEG